MLQLKKPDDFVISTGKQYSIKTFVNKVLSQLHLKGKWSGKELNESFIYKGKK